MADAIRVGEFELWRPGYGGSQVSYYKAGTSDLAVIYLDENKTNTAQNPQILQSRRVKGVEYGKLVQPVYHAITDAITITVNNIDQTGIIRPPLVSLDSVDASQVDVSLAGQTDSRDIRDFASDRIAVQWYGAFSENTSSTTNTATLQAAIGAAATAGGGEVFLPPGDIPVNNFTVPQDVKIVGAGRQTTTLQAQVSDRFATLTGHRSGFKNITLDGLVNTSGSVGVVSISRDETCFENVEIKRFATGFLVKGGKRSNWSELYINSNTIGAKLSGDTGVGETSSGDKFINNIWTGGTVDSNVTTGVELSYVDTKCEHNHFKQLTFSNNTGTALNINGAQYTDLENCNFDSNTTAVAVADDSDDSIDTSNDVIGLFFRNTRLNGGAFTATGRCENIILERCEILDVDFTLTQPENNLVFKDCSEDADVTIGGNGERIVRVFEQFTGATAGTTTGNTYTKAWSICLEPGQVGQLKGTAIAQGINTTDRASFVVGCAAFKAPSKLSYDNQSANFTLGTVLTGASSGATALIVGDTDSGDTGTLDIRSIVGNFINNEVITDTSGGSASANGAPVEQSVEIAPSANKFYQAPYRTDEDFDVRFHPNGDEIELQVKGDTSKTISWTAHVEAVLS